MFQKIRRRLTYIYAVIMAVFFILLVFGTHKSMLWSITSEQEREVLLYLEEEAHEHLILFQNKKALGSDDNDGTGRMYYYVYDNQGNLLDAERASDDVEKTIIDRIENWNVQEGDVITLERNEYKLMMAAMPIVLNGDKVGMIYVGRDVTAIYRGQEKSTIFLAVFSMIALILATIAGYIVAGRTIVPIKNAYEKQRQFTADASHELRTPLSVVMSSVDVLQNDTSQKSPFIKQVIEDMKDETKRMAKLVADLLAIARNDNYGIAIIKQKFDVIEVIEQVIRKMKPLAQAKNIKLYFAKQPIVEFHADIERIKQLLLILVDNAIKYTPKNGLVTIKIGHSQEGKKLKLMITDTGMGIPREDQTHIFDRFYRVDKARSRESGGAGLGLAIAKGIVDVHGGEISVESNVGSGSTFIVVLPKC
ncbi:MAG: integral rane sensor signal transduction histidine kinase [Massilibacillus sp.]|jgi:signal transduction histidine kinase|nr:integral rane sensor signal transduction histidine kinase [Massilibacillus sp.]